MGTHWVISEKSNNTHKKSDLTRHEPAIEAVEVEVAVEVKEVSTCIFMYYNLQYFSVLDVIFHEEDLSPPMREFERRIQESTMRSFDDSKKIKVSLFDLFGN